MLLLANLFLTMISLLNYIKNKSDIKVIGITNGVYDEKLLSDSIKKDIDETKYFLYIDGFHQL